MTNEISTISIIVTGRVQGVWFRASTKNEADRLGLIGFVKNMPNGGVYIEATGGPLELDAFTEWCGKGPELARVGLVKVNDTEQTQFQGFEVRRS